MFLDILDIKFFKVGINMTYGKYEYDQLLFLTQYGFRVQNASNGKYTEIYIFNDKCCITYHEWPQFGDFNIIITSNIDERKAYKYQCTYGLSWLLDSISLENKQKVNIHKLSHIELFVLYVKQQIQNNQDVFGMSLN